MRQEVKRVAGPLGLGVAACAACCAGPVLGVIGGLSLAGSAVALGLGAVSRAPSRVAPAEALTGARPRPQ
jgi:hypothetical protein